ncbi:MAG: diguanylate cyclase/phosphodiesterase [Mycobacterium sp.]|nr:diguanylate cyclase/phosphodiesterase [Mycobacterium sp.]
MPRVWLRCLPAIGVGLLVFAAIPGGWRGTTATIAVDAVGVLLLAATLVLRAVRVPGERLGWLAIVVAMAGFHYGVARWTTPSANPTALADHADAILAWGVTSLAQALGILRLSRGWTRRGDVPLLFDGATAGLSAAAWALVIALPHTHGVAWSLVGNEAADALLLAVSVAVMGICRWRPPPIIAVLAVAGATYAITDTEFLRRTVASGYLPGGVVSVGYVIAGLLFVVAALMAPAPPRPVQADHWSALTVPMAAALAAVALLILPDGVRGVLPRALAASAIVLSAARILVTFRVLRRLPALQAQAQTDALTAVANRRHFDDELARRLAAGAGTGLLLVDLDRFKDVNDTYGHAVGDEVLRRVAERLVAGVREGDLVARLGGDEFAVLVAAWEPDEVTAMADHVQARLVEPYRLSVGSVTLGASVGVVVTPPSPAGALPSADAVLRCADAAMYVAKSRGGGVACGALPPVTLEGSSIRPTMF